MTQFSLLAVIAFVAFVINLPFGFYRARTVRFSVPWWFAIHLPIPAVFILRRAFGFDWHAIPYLLAAAIAGQVIGARLRAVRFLGRDADS